MDSQVTLQSVTVLTNADPSQFTINVAGNNPNPSSVTRSTAGDTVNLGAGSYTIDESASVSIITQTLSDNLGADIVTETNFTGDCTGTELGIAQGSISAGQSQTCNITNVFLPDGGTVPSSG